MPQAPCTGNAWTSYKNRAENVMRKAIKTKQDLEAPNQLAATRKSVRIFESNEPKNSVKIHTYEKSAFPYGFGCVRPHSHSSGARRCVVAEGRDLASRRCQAGVWPQLVGAGARTGSPRRSWEGPQLKTPNVLAF